MIFTKEIQSIYLYSRTPNLFLSKYLSGSAVYQVIIDHQRSASIVIHNSLHAVTHICTSQAGFKCTNVKITNVVNIDIIIRITTDQAAYTGYKFEKIICTHTTDHNDYVHRFISKLQFIVINLIILYVTKPDAT